MSIHPSLAIKSSLIRARNVLTRHERILQLKRAGKWKEGENSPFGLPKVRVPRIKQRGKGKKKEEKPAAPAPGAAPAPAAPKAPEAKAPEAKAPEVKGAKKE